MGSAAPACCEPFLILCRRCSVLTSLLEVWSRSSSHSSGLSHTGGCKIKKDMSNSGLLQAPRIAVRSQLRYPGVEREGGTVGGWNAPWVL